MTDLEGRPSRAAFTFSGRQIRVARLFHARGPSRDRDQFRQRRSLRVDRHSGHCGPVDLPHAERRDAVADPGELPVDQGRDGARFRPDRHRDLRLSRNGLAAATACRTLYRQAPDALAAAVRDGLDRAWTGPAWPGRELPGRPDRRRDDRAWLVGVPPRKLAPGAFGRRKTTRICAERVSGRRQLRHSARAIGGGLHRSAPRAGVDRAFCRCRACRDAAPELGRPLVHPRGLASGSSLEAPPAAARAVSSGGSGRSSGVDPADVLEIRLHDQFR